MKRLDGIICGMIKDEQTAPNRAEFNAISEQRFALLKEYLARQGITDVGEEQKDIFCRVEEEEEPGPPAAQEN